MCSSMSALAILLVAMSLMGMPVPTLGSRYLLDSVGERIFGDEYRCHYRARRLIDDILPKTPNTTPYLQLAPREKMRGVIMLYRFCEGVCAEWIRKGAPDVCPGQWNPELVRAVKGFEERSARKQLLIRNMLRF